MQPVSVVGEIPRRSKTRKPLAKRIKNGKVMGLDVGMIDVLLLMHRCRDISVSHAVMAMGLKTEDAARARLYKLYDHGLVQIVKPDRQHKGAAPHQFSLTKFGFECLCEALAGADHSPEEIEQQIGKWSKPLTRVWSEALRDHRTKTVDAIVAVQRDIPAGWLVIRAIPEDRRDEFDGTKYPTSDILPGTEERLKFDAIALIERNDWSRMIAIEIDNVPGSIRKIEAKLRKHWRWIPTHRARSRFGADDPIVSVLFVTSSERRIGNIISGIEWQSFGELKAPDGQDVYPADVFHFCTHEQMTGNFFGRHCRVPGSDQRYGLLDGEEAQYAAA